MGLLIFMIVITGLIYWIYISEMKRKQKEIETKEKLRIIAEEKRLKDIELSDKMLSLHPKHVSESKLLKFIENSSIENVKQWFNFYKSKGHYFHDSLYYSVVDKINSEENQAHMDEMARMSAEEVKEYLAYEKKEFGTYFSDEVYNYAMTIIHKAKGERYSKLIEEMTPEKTLSWYLKRKDDEGDAFQYIDNSIEEKAHLKILELFSRDKINKAYQGKVVNYVIYNAPPTIDNILISPIFTKIIDAYSETIINTINEKYYYNLKGDIYKAKGETASAIEYYIKGMELNDAKALRRIGELYEELEDFEKTVEYFQKAIEVNPQIGLKRKVIKYKKQLGQ